MYLQHYFISQPRQRRQPGRHHPCRQRGDQQATMPRQQRPQLRQEARVGIQLRRATVEVDLQRLQRQSPLLPVLQQRNDVLPRPWQVACAPIDAHHGHQRARDGAQRIRIEVGPAHPALRIDLQRQHMHTRHGGRGACQRIAHCRRPGQLPDVHVLGRQRHRGMRAYIAGGQGERDQQQRLPCHCSSWMVRWPEGMVMRVTPLISAPGG